MNYKVVYKSPKIKRTIGMNICEARTKLGISQSKLAKMINITPAALSIIENYDRFPSFLTALKICISLDLTIEQLIKGVVLTGAKMEKTIVSA